MRKHIPTTRNIRKPGDVGILNFCTFTQIRNGLTGWSFEIPASAYCQPLCAIQERQYLGRNQNKNCNFVVKFIN